MRPGHKMKKGSYDPKFTQAQTREYLDFYLKKWPWLEDVKKAFAAWELMRSDDLDLYDQNSASPCFIVAATPSRIPANDAGLKKVQDAVRAMEGFVKAYESLTALANHLAIGREKLGFDGKQDLGITLYGIRPLTAFYESEGTVSYGLGADYSHQARGWQHELKWLKTVLPRWTTTADEWQRKNGFAWMIKFVDTIKLHFVNRHDSRWDAKKKLKWDDLLKYLDDSEKALVQSYNSRFQSLIEQWPRLLVRHATKEGHPAETSLAYTAAHLKVFANTHRQAKKLLIASPKVEKILKRLAEDGVIKEDEAVTLWLYSFDDDRAVEYRSKLQTDAGKPGGSFSTIPLKLQEWQTEKFTKAVASLRQVEKTLKTWLADNDDDPINQGVHLAHELTPEQIEAEAHVVVMDETYRPPDGPIPEEKIPDILSMIDELCGDEDPGVFADRIKDELSRGGGEGSKAYLKKLQDILRDPAAPPPPKDELLEDLIKDGGTSRGKVWDPTPTHGVRAGRGRLVVNNEQDAMDQAERDLAMILNGE